MDQPRKIRLNKFLAERLGVSRREADELISGGKVTVNGKAAILGARIDFLDKVCYNRKIVPFETDFLYIALNKPVGYVCSRRAQGTTPTLYELLPKEYQKLKTVGYYFEILTIHFIIVILSIRIIFAILIRII